MSDPAAPAQGPVERIVSLVPSVTAALIDLGGGSRIVGRTSFCPDPGSGAAQVGGTKTPDLDAILAASPDLVLTAKEENPREAVDAIRAAGVPVVVFDVNRATEVPGLAWVLGRIAGAVDEAMEMAERAADAIERARTAAADARPLRTAYLIWREPWKIAGPDTYIADVLRTCGLVDLFEVQEDRYPEASPGEIAAAGAELVLLSSEPYAFEEKHFEEFREVAGLAPGKGPAIELCRGELVGWYPSRLPEALEHLTEIREKGSGPASG